jgi:hypothetical protein
MGYDPVDPIAQDHRTMWLTGATPSTAFRHLAMVEDVKALSEAGVSLVLLSGWNQFPEAVAMVSVAQAMGKTAIELNEGIFTETKCQES